MKTLWKGLEEFYFHFWVLGQVFALGNALGGARRAFPK